MASPSGIKYSIEVKGKLGKKGLIVGKRRDELPLTEIAYQFQ
jgi:hypothetical protein